MDKINSLILIISEISYSMETQIIEKIRDFKNFDFPDKLLTFASLSLSTYQSSNIYYSNIKRFKISKVCFI